MDIVIRKAEIKDASLIGKIRRTAWEQTYRGIYPDHKMDAFDTAFHLERDLEHLRDPAQNVYLIMDGDDCAGYFSFGPSHYGKYKDFHLCLNSLYILEGYKGMGLGKQAFAILRQYARAQGFSGFFCGCNAHNLLAQGFYAHMGGTVGSVSTGHPDKSDDIIHYEFYTGDIV